MQYIAIGDIHGLDGLLQRLLKKLPVEGTLVFLGDYIDRGPDTRGVITRLLALEQQRTCVFLRGNHEAMALLAFDGDLFMRESWLRNGGLATLDSYPGGIPAEHRNFLARTRSFFTTENYIFVHAGLQPGRQPEETDPPDELLWIREPFLDSDYDWGRLVIHGHTPVREPDIQPNRINIDTAAVYGNKLTALLLPERKFVHVG